jgi:two-component system NtrC family sensor kinase
VGQLGPLAVQQDAEEVRAPVIRALAAGGAVAGVAFLLVVAATVLATRHLTRKIERANAHREEATRAFMRSAKLASVGELATGLAHEINNPLAIIAAEQTNISDLLPSATAEPALRDELVASAERIRRQVRRCASITRKMLEFGRKRDALPEPTDLAPRLLEIVSLLERQAAVRNVALRTQAGDGVPHVRLDPLELEQVLVNLITNSIQAMPAGGTIQVRTRAVPGQVWLEVEDDGEGMTPGVRERVFEPFFTTKPVGQGTGLGLSVCHGIVESWGGRLEVESAPGRGTTVRLLLPAAPEIAAAGEEGASDETQASRADCPAGG